MIKQIVSWSTRGSFWRKKRESIVEIYIRICRKKKTKIKNYRKYIQQNMSEGQNMSEEDE